MGDFNQVVTSGTVINPLITGETKKRGGLDFRVYQEMKTGIHRDLINKIDLEKVATQRDDRTRRQVFGFEFEDSPERTGKRAPFTRSSG